MIEKANREFKPAVIANTSLVEKYLARIPEDLRDLLGPDLKRLEEFALAIKALRIKEEERGYVMDIQYRYGLPLRPNESVKQTMIKVRLAILKKRREAAQDSSSVDIRGHLPVDPLE